MALPRHRWLSDVLHFAHVSAHFCWQAVLLPWRMLRTRPRFSLALAGTDALCAFLVQLGPPYVKLGQLLSTRVADLPPRVALRLSRLQDGVPTGKLVFTKKELAELVGESAASYVKAIDPEPIAAGSAAVVFRAELTDGSLVAMKVVRPRGLAATARAVSLVKRFVRWGSYIPAFARLPVVESVDDLCTALARQFDLGNERRMNELLREIFARDPRVRIPSALPHLSCDTLMTMVYRPTLTKITDLPTGLDLEASLRTGFYALFKMILEHGVIHCDFHAGNVFFHENGAITVLDTGFMEELTAVETYQFREFFIGMFLGDGPRCAKVIWDTATDTSAAVNYADFERQMCALVADHTRAKAAAFHVTQFVMRLFNIQRMCGIRGSHRFTLTILSLLMYEGLATKYVPNIDFQREALPILGPILVRRAF